MIVTLKKTERNIFIRFDYSILFPFMNYNLFDNFFGSRCKSLGKIVTLSTILYHWITIKLITLYFTGLQSKQRIRKRYSFTPWNVRVSSKHVLSNSYDGNCIPFPITPSVEDTDRTAVRGGAVAQHPSRMTSNGRF